MVQLHVNTVLGKLIVINNNNKQVPILCFCLVATSSEINLLIRSSEMLSTPEIACHMSDKNFSGCYLRVNKKTADN